MTTPLQRLAVVAQANVAKLQAMGQAAERANNLRIAINELMRDYHIQSLPGSRLDFINAVTNSACNILLKAGN